MALSSTLIDVTAHDGASAFGARIPSFLDGGVVRATFNWVPSNAAQIIAAHGLVESRLHRFYGGLAYYW